MLIMSTPEKNIVRSHQKFQEDKATVTFLKIQTIKS